jgi:hypothetical protein
MAAMIELKIPCIVNVNGGARWATDRCQWCPHHRDADLCAARKAKKRHCHADASAVVKAPLWRLNCHKFSSLQDLKTARGQNDPKQ